MRFFPSSRIRKTVFLLYTYLCFNCVFVQNVFAYIYPSADSSVINATFFSSPFQKIECKVSIHTAPAVATQYIILNPTEFFWKNEQWQKQPFAVEEILIPDSYTATNFEQIVSTGKWLSPFKNNIHSPENLIIDPQKPTPIPNFGVDFIDTLFLNEAALLLHFQRNMAVKFDTVFFEKKQTLKRTSTPRYKVQRVSPIGTAAASGQQIEPVLLPPVNNFPAEKKAITSISLHNIDTAPTMATIDTIASSLIVSIATPPKAEPTTVLPTPIASPKAEPTTVLPTPIASPKAEPTTVLPTPTTPPKAEPTLPPINTNSVLGGAVLERKIISPEEAYKQTLAEVQKRRETYAKAYKKALNENNTAKTNEILTEAATYLDDAIANDIVFYWYGTGFDKNGTAESPQKGRIACSYFVTTMLREAGFTLDRIRISQKGALDIAKYICQEQNLTHCLAVDEVMQLLEKKGQGLYIIAFNYHVGFLLYDSTGKYLIHASPLGTSTVSKVEIQTARSFEYSKFYDIGKLSDNKTLIKKWLLNEKL